MDDREFRRLCLDALRGRLDAATHARWEAHRLANPRCARFYADLAAADAALVQRMRQSPPVEIAPPLASPPELDLDNDEQTSIETRRLAYWAPVAVLVGVLATGVGALLVFGPNPGLRGMGFVVVRNNAADNIAGQPPAGNGKHSDSTPPVNQPRYKRPSPVKQPEPPPVKPPDDISQPVKTPAHTTPPPVKPPDDVPVKPPQAEPPAARILALRGDGARYRLQEPAGAPRYLTEPATLRRGDRVRLMTGTLEVDVDGLRFGCSERGEFRLTSAPAVEGQLSPRPLAAHLEFGRYVVDGLNLEDSPRAIGLDHTRLELRGAVAVIAAEWGRTIVYLLEGRALLTDGGGSRALAAGQSALIEPGRVTVPAGDSASLASLDDEWMGPRKTLLRAGFDDGIAPAAIGTPAQPGARGSPGALAWDRARPAVGFDAQGPIFTPEASTRLRFRARTNSPQLRVQFEVLNDDKWQTVAVLLKPATDQWTLYDMPLSSLRTGAFLELDGFMPDRPHRALQFRYRYPDNRVLPSERFLEIDDIEVYTPKKRQTSVTGPESR